VRFLRRREAPASAPDAQSAAPSATDAVAIFVLFGGVLETLALPLRVLIVSAVLVVVMTQLVLPLVNRIVARWSLARSRGSESAGEIEH